MMTEPKIVTKPAQPYAAIILKVAQPDIGKVAPPLIGDVVGWLNVQGVEPSGPPFFNYVSFFPDGTMEMQAGMPTASVLKADGRISTGTLPGGRFAALTHTGPYHELYEANMKVNDWAKAQGLTLDGIVDGDRFRNATRMEIYLKDPGEDPSGFPVTEVAFRIAD